jgi:hypothetical protein
MVDLPWGGGPFGREQEPNIMAFADHLRTNEDYSVVYFMGADNGLVKIGFASNFQDRFSKLCCGSPVPLVPLAIVRGGRVEERAYHEHFRRWRHHAEWFYLTDEMEEEIDRINYEQTPRHVPQRLRGMALPLTLTERSELWPM